MEIPATVDYIIVGAGSAGCVLADRLSADGKHTVLLVENGGSDKSIFIQMPTALSIPMNNPKYIWDYKSEPEPQLNNRRITTARGRVLGGSSSINGLVYVRGNPLDFNRWESEGAEGWGYRHVLPYFKRAETRNEGGDDYRGSDGPLHTRYGNLKNPLHQAWLDAATQAGYPSTSDINGYSQEGFGRMDMTVYNGKRWSTANAYLKPALKRKNLKVLTNTLVTKVFFEARRATGIKCVLGGIEHDVCANREVILCGGPINSPQLLKLSGVGPAAELAQHGIPLIHNLPGVGENLQDHLEFYFQVACTQPVSLYSVMNPISKALIGMRWILNKDGLGATNHFESCGFIRSRAGIQYPDIQYHFLPMAVTYDGSSLTKEHGYQAHVGPMRSKSRGHVRLASNKATDHPKITFNYMSDADDWAEMRACVRLTREIFTQSAFDAYREREILPGAGVVTDEQIDEFIRNKVETAYHPSCSCKMGALDDPMAVVDPTLRVIGLDNLRVVDSSVMPSITTGNLNAPTIMIGEKAADMILGKEPLPVSDAPYYVAERWQTQQR